MKYSKLKVVLSMVIISFISSGAIQAFDWTQCEERDFVLTAYYSPQEDQAFYYKDNYQKEVTLNGKGTHGASGSPVFNGMLAAPQSYDFGGKIYFPDFGVGKISDRGGAIVEAGERRFTADRIDIWVGKGEEGLIKALDFGVQRKKGYYCSAEKLKELGTIESVAPVGFDFSKIPVFAHFFDLALWKQNLWPDRRDVWVYTLQKYLVKLGYLHKNKKTGTFDKITQKALCSYQTKRLISSPKYSDCGVFGPKTRFAMKNEVTQKGLLPKDLWKHSSVENIVKMAKSWDVAESIMEDIKIKKANNDEYFDKPIAKNSYDDKVVKLQYLLQYLEYYDKTLEADGVFDQDVIDAVYAFQLKNKILKGTPSEAHLVGYVGPSTRKALNNALKSKHEAEKLAKLEELLDSKDSVGKKKLAFEFYRPYKKGELPNEEIRILQRFLQDLKLYNGEINGKYDSVTIDAVFDFQVKYGLLKEDAHYTLRGYMGPGTRNKLNEMRAFGI